LALSLLRFQLFVDLLLLLFLRLHFVDVFHQQTLVLEHVTLALHVQFVVQVFVDLLRTAVLSEHASEDTHSAHPQHLRWHTCFTGTVAFTRSRVSALEFCGMELAYAGTRVYSNRLAEDETVLY